MNPVKLLKLKTDIENFFKRHPKFASFSKNILDSKMQEGVIVEISVKYPNGNVVNSNLKLSNDDLDVLNTIKELI